MSQPAADDPSPVLTRTAFIVAWALASVLPWVMTTLLWRINYDFGIADGVAALLFGAGSGDAEFDRAYRIMHIVASHLGILLSVLIEARLLRQFRDDTRWWWIVGIAAPLAIEPLYALVPVPAGDALTVDETMAVRVVGHLLWAALTWRLIRLWGWHDRYWLGFNIVVAVAVPLIDHLIDLATPWAKVLYAQAGIRDLVALHVLSTISSGLLGAVIVSAPTAWLLWQHVVVHRRSIAPSSVG